MFGVGFFELLVIGVLGLLVFGPEKLPEAIRTLAFGFSKAKRSWQNTRRELEQELGMDEIRREIHNAQILENLEKTKNLNYMEEAENSINETGEHIDSQTADDTLNTANGSSEPESGSKSEPDKHTSDSDQDKPNQADKNSD